MKRAAILMLVGAALTVVSALPGARPAAAASGPVTIEITDGGYSPSTLTVPPHSTVTWVNKGTVAHTVTSDSGGRLDSPVLDPRYAYSYTFHEEGSFPYHGELRPGSTGTVVVADGAEPAPVLTPTPTPTPLPTPIPAPAVTPPPAPGPSGSGPDDPAPPASDTGVAAGEQQVVVPQARAVPPDGGVPEAPESAAASATTVTVDAGNEWFGEPGYQSGVYAVTVQTGDTVQWNVIEGFHNVYECGGNWGDAPGCGSAAWNSELLTEGGSFSQTFTTAGLYHYLCTIHPATMRGKIVVEAGDASDSSPTPTPVADDTNTGDIGDTDALAPPPASAAGPASAPAPVVAGEAAMPNGGGAPPPAGGMPTAPFFVAAALTLAASGLIFWRWKHVSTER